MAATLTPDCSNNSGAATASLYLALELGWSSWTIAFTTGFTQKTRRRIIPARNLEALMREVEKARKHFRLSGEAPIFCCYEAGRDGFWLHRYLVETGIQNIVVDSASIEVDRRKKRAKTDRLDAQKLVTQLLRHHLGEKKVWSVVTPPTEEVEEARQLHRELMTLKRDRTRHSNRIKGLLAGCGLSVKVDQDLPQTLKELRIWDNRSFVDGHRLLYERLLREYERMQLAEKHIRELQSQRHKLIREGEGKRIDMARQLLTLRGIGVNGGWLLAMELFWRKFHNRRQLGSLVGLTAPPYQSGDMVRDQGMSKAGSRWVRAMIIELAWCWLRFQPNSALSRWYQRRFGEAGKRMRKIGIVALARKLLIKLWQYLETGAVPQGALVVDWRSK
jgi:transposase